MSQLLVIRVSIVYVLDSWWIIGSSWSRDACSVGGDNQSHIVTTGEDEIMSHDLISTGSYG